MKRLAFATAAWLSCAALPAFAQTPAAAPVEADETVAPESAAPTEPSEETTLLGRVIVDSTPLRSGPGPAFRAIGIARRGEVFRVLGRSTRGYWWEVERPDGTHAFILGDALYNYEVGADEARGGRFLPRLFAPAPLPSARMEIAVMLGWMDGSGVMAVRPTLLVAPTFGIEIEGAAAVSRAGRLFRTGIGAVVNLAPRSPVVPFFAVGGGLAHSLPNADTFLLQRGTVGMLYAGGGLRFCFRYRLTLRIEARAFAFFEPDRYVAREEIIGGLTVFF